MWIMNTYMSFQMATFSHRELQFTAIDIHATVSVRCKGAARDFFLTKNLLEQKSPLPVDQVRWLDSCIMHASNVEAWIRPVAVLCAFLFSLV